MKGKIITLAIIVVVVIAAFVLISNNKSNLSSSGSGENLPADDGLSDIDSDGSVFQELESTADSLDSG